MSLLRRTLLRGLALGACAILWAGTASAVTFSGSYGVTLHTSTNFGVGLSETDINQPVFNLANVNDSMTISPLFKINVLESCCSNHGNDDDTTANSISAAFSFISPTGGSGSPVTGTTQGHIIAHAPDTITVAWSGPVTFSFSGGVSLQIALSDLTISCPNGEDNSQGCKPRQVKDNPKCEDDDDDERHKCSTHTVFTSGNVDGKFTLLSLPPVAVGDAPAVTPLPAALPLFLGGAGVIGLLARRRKRNATSNC